MLFHSLTFWVFFAIIAALYSRLSLRGQNRLLLLASNLFYGWWDWRFLPLIWYSISVDYCIGKFLGRTDKSRNRKLLLTASVVSNLGLLFFFKYLNFFAGEYCRLIGLFGEHHDVPLWIKQIVLPIGISFYTFQTLSYTVDLYRRRAKPVSRYFDYALYCSFFPQLLAGPIERPAGLMPQLMTERKPLTQAAFSEGLYHLVTGFFKKIVIADNMAVLVNHIFSVPGEQRSAWEVLIGAYAFAFQIYGDFSGYSSMAQGIARWLGFELTWNFRRPFLSTSPQVFWQRWHISLSTWLRDYLFMPLMGSGWIVGIAKVYVATMIVQLMSGVWHGANWTFLAWGALHGAYLIGQLWLTRKGWFKEPKTGGSNWYRIACIFGTFQLMGVGMILFRAESIGQAFSFFGTFGSNWNWTPLVHYGIAQLILFAAPLMAFEVWLERKNDDLALLKVDWKWRALVYAGMVFMIWFLPPENTGEFIYFQF